MMTSRVFAVQVPTYYDQQTGEYKSQFDLSPAQEYGRVSILLDSNIKPFDTEKLVRILRNKLADFCDDDYLICIGNPVVQSIAFAIAAEMNDGFVTCLQWTKNRNYVAIPVDLNEDATLTFDASEMQL